MKRAFILLLTLPLLLNPLTACSSEPAKPSTPPPSATATLPPTQTQPPPSTSTSTPTPTPVPSVPEIVEEYRRNLAPLVNDLQAAQEPPPDLELPSVGDLQIVLIPLQEPAYYAQALLFPGLANGGSEQEAVVYVTYSYYRGADLVYGYVSIGPADTQEVIVDLQVILAVDGTYHLLEEAQAVGGEGTSSEDELVQEAVVRLETLGPQGEEFERTLECILGYATGAGGSDLCPEGHAITRTQVALLLHALESDYWADWRAAAESLGVIGPEAEPAVPRLIDLLHYKANGAKAVEGQASFALILITDQNLGEEPDSWVTWWIGQLGGIQGAATLLEEGDLWQRRMAADTLASQSVDAIQTLPALLNALVD